MHTLQLLLYVHMCGRVMHLVVLVCVHMCVKNQLFSALPLENLLLSVFDYFFTEFKCLVCYVQQAVQTEQFMFFQVKLGGSLGLGIFSSEL